VGGGSYVGHCGVGPYVKAIRQRSARCSSRPANCLWGGTFGGGGLEGHGDSGVAESPSVVIAGGLNITRVGSSVILKFASGQP